LSAGTSTTPRLSVSFLIAVMTHLLFAIRGSRGGIAPESDGDAVEDFIRPIAIVRSTISFSVKWAAMSR
jgi:hypothetical protein